jgi:hypothetical protein
MLAFHPGTSSSDTNVLARKASANDIDGNSIGSKPIGCEGSHVIVAGHSRPMLRQHPLAEWVNLAERHRLESARPLQAKVEAAYPGEK